MTLLARGWLMLQAFVASLVGMKQRELELHMQIWALAPASGPAAATAATLLVECGQPAAAIDVLQQTLERSPDYASGWFNLGYIHEQQNDAAAAERCFRRALDLDRKLDRAWYGLALVLIRGGRLPEAVAALKENIRLQPFSPYGFYQLGMTYHHLGQTEDARRVCKQLQQFEPRYAATLERDLDNTQPHSRTEAAPSTSTATEALIAST